MATRLIRTTAVVALAALALGAFAAAPAEAKKKKPAACKPYAPGEVGTGKPLVKVTDAATEAAPIAQTVSIDPSAADADVVGTGEVAPGTDAFNVQVDSKAKEAGLYVLVEFPDRRDYDLNLWWADGSYAARSHGFQPVLGTPAEGQMGNLSGYAGESTSSSEKVVGIATPDCGGYTVSVENYLGEGGDLTVKVWLGEIKNDPQAPGAETP